jgi:Fur family ferric uptake transcriptional regulator
LENQQLKKAGLKVTLPRVKILQILENSEEPHMSAEDVYKALLENDEEVGLATVYRVLTQFEQAGLVVRHNFEGGHSVFEIERGEHHDHMVCLDSGKVIEFHNEEIEQLQKKIAEEHGYRLVDHSLVLYVKPKKGE